MKTKILSGLLLVSILIPFASSVKAVEDPVWQTPAMACVPTHATSESASYITTAGVTKNKDNINGKSTFICPITINTNFKNGFYRIRGFYEFNNVASPLTKFGIQLRKRSLIEPSSQNNSAVQSLLLANIVGRGNAFPVGTLHSRAKEIEFDFNRNVYWVQFTVAQSGHALEGILLYHSKDKPNEQQPPPIAQCTIANCCPGSLIPADESVSGKPECFACKNQFGLCPLLPSDIPAKKP